MTKTKNLDDLISAVDTATLLSRPLSEWRPILSQECQVYVIGANYIAKRFDQINYRFCDKMTAKEILIDNLYSLLRYKYFPKPSDEADDRINKIVASFTANLKTTLRKVSFDKTSDADLINFLPDGCIAFRNGVFDFRKNDWLFKYNVIKVPRISNSIYLYDPSYAIMWYFDYEFESLDIDLNKTSLNEFIDMMKVLTTQPGSRNFCFELMYNISHDINDKYSQDKFVHLCEILGYTCLQSFCQAFIFLIGTGQNGKNSLFDGCFTHRLVPRAAANDLDEIENDRFVTGSLENTSHNIFLESSGKTYTESKMIKALTGSMNQTIQNKGTNKYSSFINCKFVFAGNEQDKIKFVDNTTGFRRRINMLEIFYRWDAAKRFLKKGDYFDTTFSDSLRELTDDPMNTTVYIYFAMYGIMHATENFKRNFRFSFNDWTFRYSDVDMDMKDKIDGITNQSIVDYIQTNQKTLDEGKRMFFDMQRVKLFNSRSMRDIGITTFDELVEFFKDTELFISYFAEHDVYMSVRAIQAIIKDLSTAAAFTQQFKKAYIIQSLEILDTNRPYVKVTFMNGKLRILK